MSSDFDILIIGGGLVGASLAGLLGEERRLDSLRIGLVEAQPPSQPPPGGDIDIRVSAVSRVSRDILTRAGGWQQLASEQVSPYTDMVVWDAAGDPSGPGSIHFDASSTSDPDLGSIVENRRLQWALYCSTAMRERITLFRAHLTGMVFDRNAARTTVALSDGRCLSARLVVGADGAASPSRELAGIDVTAHSYHQFAVVTHVRTARPHRRTAWQRFLPAGPLALLPLADGRSSIVWSTIPDHAARLVEMAPDEFARELEAASAGVLGAIELAAPRARFPLQRMHAHAYYRPGYVLVGDAAHAVHPLAGQGVNLGFADCASLAETLGTARAAGPGWYEHRVLRHYERSRKSGNLLALGVIDTLGRLFGNADPRVGALRRTGLTLLDRSTLAKRLLISRATR